MRLYSREVCLAKKILKQASLSKVLMIDFVYHNAYTVPVKVKVNGKIMQITITNGSRVLEKHLRELIKNNKLHIFVNRCNLWKYVKEKGLESIKKGKAFYEECKNGFLTNAFEKVKKRFEDFKAGHFGQQDDLIYQQSCV